MPSVATTSRRPVLDMITTFLSVGEFVDDTRGCWRTPGRSMLPMSWAARTGHWARIGAHLGRPALPVTAMSIGSVRGATTP